ncbi:uncharacterized protein VNE69_10059 [Vairimorpha necatrix]|uniref:Uncharacterized protein n=1 Tax=Vairimorpha necatrix TaxID=6039 RepID=A0AAX4JFZ2_9MICR
MNIAVIFYFIFIIKNCKQFYNSLNFKINYKIQERDYLTLSFLKQYVIVIIRFDTSKNELNADISRIQPNATIRENLNSITLHCDNKSVQIIVYEFEYLLKNEINSKFMESIVLIYKPKYFEDNIIFKKIINKFKEVNINRNSDDELSYEYILDEYSLLSTVLTKMKIFHDYNYDPIKQHSYIAYVENKDIKHIGFCITFNHVYCFFEVNVKELYAEKIFNLVSADSSFNGIIDMTISKHFRELFDYVYINNIKTNYKGFFPDCTYNKIKSVDGTFEIKIKNHKIYFSHKKDVFIYSLRIKNIDKRCFNEFQKIFKRFLALKEENENFRIIILFFRLMNSHNKIGLLANRILNKPRTALNILFSHLLLNQGLIEENELDKIIKNEDFDECNRKELIKNLLDNLNDNVYISNAYIMKICLFIEAENLINEIENDNNSIFGTLKNIGNNILVKIFSQNSLKILKLYILGKLKKTSLLTIFQELVNSHMNTIEVYGISTSTYLSRITSLFTGLENNTCKNSWYTFNAKKSEVLEVLRFDETEIERNNKSIRRGLSKNFLDFNKLDILNSLKKDVEKIDKNTSMEEIKYFKNRVKNILIDINMIEFNEDITKIIDEALLRDAGNLFDYKNRANFENELRNLVNIELEKIFKNNYFMEKLENVVKSVDKDLLNDYKKEAKLKLYQNIKINIEKNARANSIIYFQKVIIDLFRSFFYNDTIEIKQCENNMKNTLSILEEDILISYLHNDISIKINETLIKILENH